MTSRALRRAVLIFLALAVIVALVLGAFLASIPPPPAEVPAVRTARLVISLPRAGPVRARSDGIANAVRLAVDQASGKVSTAQAVYEIAVAVFDSSGADGAWSETAERANIEQAVADPDTVAYIGPGTLAAARVVAPIAARAGLAVIAPTLTAPALTKPGFDEELFAAVHPDGATVLARVIPSDDRQAAAMARWARDQGARTYRLVTDGSPFAAWMTQAFAEAARPLGLAGPSSGADFVYLAGTSPEALADAAVQRGTARAGGTEALLAETFLERAGGAAADIAATFIGRPVDRYEGPALQFVRAYREAHARDPDPYAVFGYEAARLALHAIGKAGGDRARVRAAIFGAKAVAGALGAWDIDERGDTTFDAYQLYLARSLPGGRVAWSWEREIRP